MLNEQVRTTSPSKIPIQQIKETERCRELADEVKANVIGFIMFVTLCNILTLLILTTVLLIIFPPLAVVGGSLIAFSLNHSLKSIQELDGVSEA